MIKQLNLTEITKIYKQMMPEAFPANEIRPYNSIKSQFEAGNYLAFGDVENGNIKSYAMFFLYKNICLLDYLATDHSIRNQGLGGKLLDHCTAELSGKYLFLLEVESPESTDDRSEIELRRHRISFYERHGVIMSGVRTEAFTVNYNIMYASKETIPDNIIRESIDEVYKHIVSPDLYKGNFTVFPD